MWSIFKNKNKVIKEISDQSNLEQKELEKINNDLMGKIRHKNHTDTINQRKSVVKIKPRKGLGDELMEVYETVGDEFTSVTTLEHRRRSWQKILFGVLLFLVAVFLGVAMISWMIWGGRQQFTGDNVDFSIEGPEQAYSGQLITYSIRYNNNDTTSFRKSELELRYPPGFIFESASIEPNNSNNLWDLGSLGGGSQSVIELKGYLVGRPDFDTTISGVFRYWPANFSSEFQEVASTQTKMSNAKFELRVDGPEQILVGQNTTYSIMLANDGEQSIDNLKLEIIFPPEFVVEEILPVATEKNNFFLIDSISPEEEKEIQIGGYFSTSAESDVEFIAIVSQKGAGDNYFSQKEEHFDVKIIEGDLIVNVIANGSTKDSTLQWGDVINITVSYQNNSQTELADLEAKAIIESRYTNKKSEKASSGILDWDALIDSNRGSLKELEGTDEKTLRKRGITWNSEDVSMLNKLEAEDEGEINFQIPVLTFDQASKAVLYPEEVQVVLTVVFLVGKTGEVENEMVVASNPIIFYINTNLHLDAHSRYYSEDGERLGSGPIPPEVGEKTIYKIVWELTNMVHEVENIIVSTELPNNVSWVNNYSVDAGEVEFSVNSNTVTWRLNKMPIDINNAIVGFDVALKPKETQIGDVANLTEKITLTATDSVTGGKIIQAILPLNSGVDRDIEASDKGVVVE